MRISMQGWHDERIPFSGIHAVYLQQQILGKTGFPLGLAVVVKPCHLNPIVHLFQSGISISIRDELHGC